MLTEAQQVFLVELQGWDGGHSLLPSPPTTPKKHRYQGGLLYSSMIHIEGRVLAPRSLGGRRMRVWLSQLESWHFSKREPPHIGDLYDRTGELPGGGLEAMIYIPKDAWLTALTCLGATWRRLELRGVDGDGRRMTVTDLSFSSDIPPPP